MPLESAYRKSIAFPGSTTVIFTRKQVDPNPADITMMHTQEACGPHAGLSEIRNPGFGAPQLSWKLRSPRLQKIVTGNIHERTCRREGVFIVCCA